MFFRVTSEWLLVTHHSPLLANSVQYALEEERCSGAEYDDPTQWSYSKGGGHRNRGLKNGLNGVVLYPNGQAVDIRKDC